jgi:CHASE3 domain sensor protein
MNELLSLRAQVKKFESGRQIQKICSERDRALRKFEKAENNCLRLSEENQKLNDENRSLKFSLDVLEGNYARLLSAYEAHIEFYSEQ